MVLLKAAAGSLILLSCSAPSKAWMYRDENCHGMIYKKYDVVLDKAYNQLELAVLFFHFLEHCQLVFHQPCPSPFQTILLLRVGGQRQSDP